MVVPYSTTKQIPLEYGYSELDFLDAIKNNFPQRIIEKLGDNFQFFGFDKSGMIFQMIRITNLPEDYLVFLYNNNFCEEKLLARLKEIEELEFAPSIVYSGITSLHNLLEKEHNILYNQRLEKIIGRDLGDLYSKLKGK